MHIVAIKVREVEIELRLRSSGDRAEVVFGRFEHLGSPLLAKTGGNGAGKIKRGKQRFADHWSTQVEVVD
jgi:hypothetical protein